MAIKLWGLYMRILTLNMNMFNFYQADDSFNIYIEEIKPDIAIIQECRYNRLVGVNENYKILLPNGYTKNDIDNRIHFTLALHHGNVDRENNSLLKKYGYTFLKMKVDDINSVLAVHIPLKDDKFENEYNILLNAIKNSNSKLICGDFNASMKKNSPNYRFLRELIEEQEYFDLWSEGLNDNKSYYINYKGKEIKAEKNILYRTYIGNTFIDYILGKKRWIHFDKILIDTRTLSFTDHCGIIADIEFVKSES